jgi:hypothetical protein
MYEIELRLAGDSGRVLDSTTSVVFTSSPYLLMVATDVIHESVPFINGDGWIEPRINVALPPVESVKLDRRGTDNQVAVV